VVDAVGNNLFIRKIRKRGGDSHLNSRARA
jgi:hypothetical protein